MKIPEYGPSERRTFHPALVKRGFRKKHSVCICTQDAKDQGRSDQRGGSQVLEAWALGRKNEFVFYNFETGKPFVDLKTGFAQACRKAGIAGVTWKTLRHAFASRLEIPSFFLAGYAFIVLKRIGQIGSI